MQARSVRNWLWLVCFMVLVMVTLGGITRLTHSGLSIVDWAPIMGTLPPLNEAQWQEVFTRYQQFPEYQLINHGMSLSEFKWIYFWEYLHRLWGRLIGLVFFFPLLFFSFRKDLTRSFKWKLWFGFFLGGMQGVIGWVMVQSGLVDVPAVSHYRLAIHLLLAFTILVYLLWLSWDLSYARSISGSNLQSVKKWSLFWVILLGVQITYGAFVAGLKAGFAYPTFPLMNGSWVPSIVFEYDPAWFGFLQHPPAVQWVHRWLGVLVFLSLVGLVIWIRRQGHSLSDRQQLGLRILLSLTVVQFFLGIATLVFSVPLFLGASHQAVAALLWAAAFYWLHSLRKN